MRTIELTDDDAEVLERLLLRAIAADRSELARLTMLSTAYGDHVRGEAASRELAAVRNRIEVAQRLVDQVRGVPPSGTG